MNKHKYIPYDSNIIDDNKKDDVIESNTVKNTPKSIKTSITIPFDKINTWERFKSIVVLRHGKLHKALSDELFKLIMEYIERYELDKQQQSTSSIHDPTHRRDVAYRLLKIRRHLIDKGYTYLITELDLTKEIKICLEVKDNRTIRKYVNEVSKWCEKKRKGPIIFLDISKFLGSEGNSYE